MKKIPGTGILMALTLLIGAAALPVAGCGRNETAVPSPQVSGYLLDPPTLAADGFSPIADGVPVFCYHYFRSGFDGSYLVRVLGSVLFGMPALGPREFWTTPVGEFEKHLRFFRDTGTVVMTLDEVADRLEAGRPLPSRAAVLTIDDADRSVYELAWPLLEKYGMRAHLFVPTSKVGTSWSELEVCTWEELAEMAASGHVLVESHTRDLHYKVRVKGDHQPVFFQPEGIPVEDLRRNLNDLARRARAETDSGLPSGLDDLLAGPNRAVAADLVLSRIELAERAGVRSRWLAWPYGFATDALDSLGRAVGFRGTVSLVPEAFTNRDSTRQVGRFALTAKSTTAHIAGVFPD